MKETFYICIFESRPRNHLREVWKELILEGCHWDRHSQKRHYQGCMGHKETRLWMLQKDSVINL